MIEQTLDRTNVLRNLGDGLVLRCGRREDAAQVADFNARMHTEDGRDKPDERIRVWTRELMEQPHPTVSAGDFTVVEDTAAGRIVSSCMLISQTWAYGGVPFGVGRPELVATAPEYRRRGLIRAQFEVLHQWSAERSQRVQVITGIPFYYRQFGYEMALNLDGGRGGFEPQVPRLKDGETEPYVLRLATEADLPFVAELYTQTVGAREPVTCVRSLDEWKHELAGRGPGSLVEAVIKIIATPGAEPVGYLVHGPYLWPGGKGNALGCWGYELKPGRSWLAVTPSVIRHLWAAGEALAAEQQLPMQRFVFSMGESHPVYDACPGRLPLIRAPYAYYVRVPDVGGFIRHVAPVLEARLARSIAAGHSGELKLNFYRSGVRLTLEQGWLVSVEDWQPSSEDEGDPSFPNLTFLQLLFGYRSLDELRQAYADVQYGNDTARALLNALFPRQASQVWAVN